MDLLIGGPGTGKTTALVNKIKELHPNTFALLSFTRQAANEAKERLSKLYKPNELDWIRTIHSLAFRVLRLNRGSIFTDEHLQDFGHEYGFEFSNKYTYEEDGTTDELTEDDITYRLVVISQTLGEYSYQFNENIDQDAVKFMIFKYNEYKRNKGLLDFNDILKLCTRCSLPKFDLLCVDEAQDLSPLQFAVIDKLAQNSKHIIYAGDDDQMIYEWAGVKRSLFMELADKCDKEVLTLNYRLPGEIINKSQKIIDKCKDRINKPTNITTNHTFPAMKRVYDFDEIDRFDPQKSYLILTRNGWFLKTVRDMLNDLELPWQYLKYNKGPRKNIQISTIHGSKGAEADVVILFTDVTNATYQNITNNSEHRVWYVGMTRTKNQLIIVEPQSKYSYDL